VFLQSALSIIINFAKLMCSCSTHRLGVWLSLSVVVHGIAIVKPSPEKLQAVNAAHDVWVKELNNRMWEGDDLTVEEMRALKVSKKPKNLKAKKGKHASLDPPSGHDWKVTVVGMFGAGTNLMQEFLETNDLLGVKDTEIDTGHACDDLENNRKTVSCDTFWKHTFPLRIQKPHKKTPVMLVAMVRNPMSQYTSWMRSPFNLYPCFEGNDPLEACSCSEHCDGYHCGSDESHNYFPCGKVTMSELSTPIAYGSTLDVWNEYVRGYQALSDDSAPVNITIVRYEDLVLDPASVLETLTKALGLKEKGVDYDEVNVVDDNQRTFDEQSVGRDEAIQKIQQKEYRKLIDSRDVDGMCKALDKTLLHDKQYDEECKLSWLARVGHAVADFGR